MNARLRLSEGERARLLGLIGIERHVLRSAEATPNAADDAVAAAPLIAVVAEKSTPPRRAPTPDAALSRATPASSRTSLLDELGDSARAPKLLLIVESPRAPDPRTKPMFAAIRSLLPPHQIIDAGDTPEQWPSVVIALGGSHQPPPETRFVQSLSLQYLRGNAAAKRALWRSMRTLLRPTRGA